MKKEFKVNGKVTYPQGAASRTTYTLIDDVGNMITLYADTDTDFDYGDDVVMNLEKKSTASGVSDSVTGSVTTGDTTTTAPTDTTSTDTDKSDATTAADATTTADTAATDTTSTTTETEAK